MANDFVLSDGGAKVHLLKTDIHNWNITFVDTGLHASIGERLRAVRHLLARRRDVPGQLRRHADRRGPAGDDRPREGGRRDGELPRGAPELQLPRRLDERRPAWCATCSDVTASDIWINGGYFVMRREFLDQLRPGEDLVEEPFQRLARRPTRCSRSGTRASGLRWTPSRTSSGSRACTRAAAPRGSCGTPTASPAAKLAFAVS